MREVLKVEMPYFGQLSENNYKLPNRCTKPEVKAWMRELANKVSHLPKADYTIGVHGCFLDERRPDIPNLFKVILDAVQDGIGINDKHFQAMDEKYELGWFQPKLVITIYRED